MVSEDVASHNTGIPAGSSRTGQQATCTAATAGAAAAIWAAVSTLLLLHGAVPALARLGCHERRASPWTYVQHSHASSSDAAPLHDGTEGRWEHDIHRLNVMRSARRAAAVAAVGGTPTPSSEAGRGEDFIFARRWTLQAARDCLRHKRVIVMGDSITRYQYRNLVYFLSTGRWQVDGPNGPLNEAQRQWSSWEEYFMGTNSRLQCQEASDIHKMESEKLSPDVRKMKLSGENHVFASCEFNATVAYLRWMPPVPLTLGRFPFYVQSLRQEAELSNQQQVGVPRQQADAMLPTWPACRARCLDEDVAGEEARLLEESIGRYMVHAQFETPDELLEAVAPEGAAVASVGHAHNSLQGEQQQQQQQQQQEAGGGSSASVIYANDKYSTSKGLAADAIIINQGYWKHATLAIRNYHTRRAALRALALAAHKVLAPRAGLLIWKATTPTQSGKSPPIDEDDFLADARRAGFTVLDAYGHTCALPMNASAYWDSFHFYPFVYQALNERLLDMLCPETVGAPG